MTCQAPTSCSPIIWKLFLDLLSDMLPSCLVLFDGLFGDTCTVKDEVRNLTSTTAKANHLVDTHLSKKKSKFFFFLGLKTALSKLIHMMNYAQKPTAWKTKHFFLFF